LTLRPFNPIPGFKYVSSFELSFLLDIYIPAIESNFSLCFGEFEEAVESMLELTFHSSIYGIGR
jgi:hypothetical protein